MKKIFYYWVLVLIVVLSVDGYATPASDINFLLTSLSQDRELNTILLGYIDLDELPSKLKKKVVSIGYKPGDLVPAKCVLPSLQSKKGVISILVPPAKDLASKDRKDWKKLGSFHPILFDTMEKWKKRNEAPGEIKDPNAIEPLIAALKDKNPDVRWRAAQKLGRIKDPRALGPLIAALKDKILNVRRRASGALYQIDRNWTNTDAARQSVPDFIAALKDTNSVIIRSSAAEALGRIKDPRAVEPLLALLKDTSSDFIREAVVKALRQITGLGILKYDNWMIWWIENKEDFMKNR